MCSDCGDNNCEKSLPPGYRAEMTKRERWELLVLEARAQLNGALAAFLYADGATKLEIAEIFAATSQVDYDANATLAEMMRELGKPNPSDSEAEKMRIELANRAAIEAVKNEGGHG